MWGEELTFPYARNFALWHCLLRRLISSWGGKGAVSPCHTASSLWLQITSPCQLVCGKPHFYYSHTTINAQLPNSPLFSSALILPFLFSPSAPIGAGIFLIKRLIGIWQCSWPGWVHFPPPKSTPPNCSCSWKKSSASGAFTRKPDSLGCYPERSGGVS